MAAECPYSKKCGGCDYQGMSYEAQLKKKNRDMQMLFGGFCRVSPIIGMKEPLHYRCKVTATYGYQKGKYIAGVYEKGSHRLVGVDDCLITNSTANAIILSVRDLLKDFKIKTYNEDTDYGLLRHVQIRVGQNTGQIMVVLVCGSPIFPNKNNFVKALRLKHPQISTVVLNINDKKTNMVLGQRNIVLYGKGYIEDELCGLKFRISPNSFYQVNPVQTKILYELAMDYAGLTGKEIVMDAYCGTGTIGLIAGKQAKNVISVELNPDAVKDAITNAKVNGIKNVRFYQGDATQFILAMAEKTEEKEPPRIDCIFMDPPRSGSTPDFIKAVSKLSPKRVVYISCGPESLARDLKLFVKLGYKVDKLQPVDCFPVTEHTECVCLLTR